MDSVIFKDNSEMQKEKRIKRKEMLEYSTDAINKALNISKTKFWKYKINTLT